jgi:hypothetical protein
MSELQAALAGVITVGPGGRGFIVEATAWIFPEYFVITAAHCLPQLPPPHGFSDLQDRTYENLLAPLGGTPSVWCECLFVDPVADIAVLA